MELLSHKELLAEIVWESLPKWFQDSVTDEVAHLHELDHLQRIAEFDQKWARLDEAYNNGEVDKDIFQEYERELNEIDALYYKNYPRQCLNLDRRHLPE